MNMKFGLIGNGTIATRHKEAIKFVDGELVWIYDPANEKQIFLEGNIDKKTKAKLVLGLHRQLFEEVDWVVICSPTYLHRAQVRNALSYDKHVICEKPLCLPWEPLIDDNRINIVLQLRWIKNLPAKADLIRAVMVRDKAFFETWKGNPMMAGGNIYEFFIHYIDLAIQLGASFEGQVLPTGKQERIIVNYSRPDYIDIMNLDMQDCYNRMYWDILQGRGVKPKDIFYLTWVLNKFSERFGYRNSGINEPVKLDKDFLMNI